jgi:hypothetical protein
MTVFQKRPLVHIEQLQQLVTPARASSAAKRTAPQWQLQCTEQHE